MQMHSTPLKDISAHGNLAKSASHKLGLIKQLNKEDIARYHHVNKDEL